MARANIQFVDASNEKSTAGVTSTALTSANFDAQQTAFSALRTAMQALSLGDISQYSIATLVNPAFTVPTNPFAQRELKWLVTYTGDTSGKTFQIEIPAADLGNDHLIPGTDQADTTDADWTAFITAFEAFAKSPDDATEAVTFVNARLVGRNI